MTSTAVTITDPFALNDPSGPTGDRLTYVEIVHERFRGRAPEEILRLAEVAPKFWDGGPCWPGDIEDASGLSEDVCKRGRTLLQRADLLSTTA